jgi:Lrp/AsnC family transcriptional regulator, leucine-responsive regulatory protein
MDLLCTIRLTFFIEIISFAIIFIVTCGMNKAFLDKFDESILVLLQNDARQSVSDIASSIGLSEPACYRRIRRLREDGIVDKEIAIVNPRVLGWPLSMMVLLSLETDRSQVIDKFVKRLQAIPEVLDIWYVTGDYDFVLHVIAQDMAYFETFARRVFHSDVHVKSFKTLVTMRHSKKYSPIPATSDTKR